MVINVGALKSGDDCLVEHDIRSVVEVAHEYNVTCKVIIETALLTDDEKVRACLAAKKAGADFVKTSTGFSKSGATVADIALMRRTVGSELGVKASGGVKGIRRCPQAWWRQAPPASVRALALRLPRKPPAVKSSAGTAASY